MKTAALFATATELGAFINEASPEIISTMKSFGLKLGVAYQIYDDCLDLAGDEETVGKTLGSDLRKGKLTLPILHLLQHSSSKDQQSLSAAILRGDEEDILDLTDAAHARGALHRRGRGRPENPARSARADRDSSRQQVSGRPARHRLWPGKNARSPRELTHHRGPIRPHVIAYHS